MAGQGPHVDSPSLAILFKIASEGFPTVEEVATCLGEATMRRSNCFFNCEQQELDGPALLVERRAC